MNRMRQACAQHLKACCVVNNVYRQTFIDRQNGKTSFRDFSQLHNGLL